MDLVKSTATSEAKAPLPEQGARRDNGVGGGVDMMAAATMVLLQLFNTGMVLLSKVSISGGMFIFALLTYRSRFGGAVILPLALLRERGEWKEMHWHAAGWIFLNAFIGYAVPNGLAYYGLQDTTASYAIIFLNIIPLTTFILSILFRMEAFRIRSTAGSLKIAGVLLSVGGAMIISLYKGKILHLWHPIFHVHNKEQVDAASHQLRGAMLLAGSSFMFACWYLIQPKVLKVYPYKYWSSMWTCLFGGFQTALAGVVVQRNKKAWRIGWDINLVTIVYSEAKSRRLRDGRIPSEIRKKELAEGRDAAATVAASVLQEASIFDSLLRNESEFSDICDSAKVSNPLPTVDPFLSVYKDTLRWKDVAESVASVELSGTMYWVGGGPQFVHELSLPNAPKTNSTAKERTAELAKDLCGQMQRWFLAFVEEALDVENKWKHNSDTSTLLSQFEKISDWLKLVEHQIVEEEEEWTKEMIKRLKHRINHDLRRLKEWGPVPLRTQSRRSHQ